MYVRWLETTPMDLRARFLTYTNRVHKRDRKCNNVMSRNTYISIGNLYEHSRYACCTCIEEKQIVVITNFCNQSL